MKIEYQKVVNELDIYEFFNELENSYGLKYSNSAPDPLMAAQGYEFTQYDYNVQSKEKDGRNLQYLTFSLEFLNIEDCDSYFEEFFKRLGLLERFACIYCRTGERSGVVIFNIIDFDGHRFGEFEEKRFMSLFAK